MMVMKSYFAQHEKKGIVIAVIVFLVILIVPIALAGVYYQTSSTLTSQEVTKEQTLSDLASLALKIKLDRLVNIASSIAASPKVITSVEGAKWADAAAAARDLQNNVDLYDPFIDRIIIYDINATQQAAYPALTGGLGTNASSSAWYAALKMGGQSSFVTNVSRRTSLPQIQVVNIVAPIRSAQGTVGFVVLQIPADNFLEFSADLSLGTYGFGYVVDAGGNLVAHPRFSSDGSSVVNYSFVPQVQKVLAGNSGTDVVSDQIYKEKSIVTYKPIDNYGWGIITQELYSEAFSTRSSILLGLGSLIAIITLIDILVSYLVFRLLTSKKHE
jgi:hypothetical protein